MQKNFINSPFYLKLYLPQCSRCQYLICFKIFKCNNAKRIIQWNCEQIKHKENTIETLTTNDLSRIYILAQATDCHHFGLKITVMPEHLYIECRLCFQNPLYSKSHLEYYVYNIRQQRSVNKANTHQFMYTN